jgi:hypothetical protein
MAIEIQPKPVGGVGYPMVMAVLSGSELLGALTSGARQGDRIESYWTNFMGMIEPSYADVGPLASELARNGIAHSYLSHLGVMVIRGQPARHLTLSGGEVVLDCLELYSHFRRSFIEHAEPAIQADLTAVQRRLDTLVQHDEVKARALIAKLPPERFPRS